MSGERDIARYLEPTQLPPGVRDVVAPEIEILPSPFLKETAIFVSTDLPGFVNDENNVRGFETEQRVGRVLASLSYVKEVTQAEIGSVEDKNMIDLMVSMVDGFIIPDVYVQVKSSSLGVHAFFKGVGKRMRMEGPLPSVDSDVAEHERRMRWLRDRRLVVINGEMRETEEQTEEYIAGKFFRELIQIIEHERQLPIVA